MRQKNERTTVDVLKDAGLVLATRDFTRSTLVNNGERRYYTRERWLSLREIWRDRSCASCGAQLVRGDLVAFSTHCTYCLGCVAWMTEEQAYIQAFGKDGRSGTLLAVELEPVSSTAPLPSAEQPPADAGKRLVLLVKEFRHLPMLQQGSAQ